MNKKGKVKNDTKTWLLPPNLYNTIKIPFQSKRGAGGAYWPKKHVQPIKRLQVLAPFYNIPTGIEKLFTTCNKSKGVFLTNARERRPTARSMIDNTGTCNKIPSEPGPTSYNLNQELSVFSKSITKKNPHLFYRLSTVPVKNNSIHKSHISFTAAPGRYEIRYFNICPCSSKFIYQPQLDIIIENEKYKKFRRLPYKKMHTKHYISPDWRHIKGHGFRYLFQRDKTFKSIVLSIHEAKKLKNIPIYANAKYISMINYPARTPLSLRIETIIGLKPQIRFNTVAKKIMRKQLKSNKKIAFNTTQERFKDSFRLPIITKERLEDIKQSLPTECQLRDHPVMQKRLSQIKSKIYEKPKYIPTNYDTKLRKKLFKFQPLPEAKILILESSSPLDHHCIEGYFLKTLDEKIFFRDDIELKKYD
ncbi:uncharacterized protein ACRADG_011586 [Cochliomyia hominivorax]